MQLLEITFRHLKLAPILLLSPSYAFSENLCNRESITNPEIIKCSQEAFKKIDKTLNEQYRNLIKEIDEKQKNNLVQTQRAWIKFKENHCGDAHEVVNYGNEASIDRISCLTQITSTRLSELIYLRTGVINDGFYKAVSIVNKKITNYDYNQAMTILGGSGDFGEPWENYATKHCSMTLSIYKEDNKRCISRMRFQTPIN